MPKIVQFLLFGLMMSGINASSQAPNYFLIEYFNTVEIFKQNHVKLIKEYKPEKDSFKLVKLIAVDSLGRVSQVTDYKLDGRMSTSTFFHYDLKGNIDYFDHWQWHDDTLRSFIEYDSLGRQLRIHCQANVKSNEIEFSYFGTDSLKYVSINEDSEYELGGAWVLNENGNPVREYMGIFEDKFKIYIEYEWNPGGLIASRKNYIMDNIFSADTFFYDSNNLLIEIKKLYPDREEFSVSGPERTFVKYEYYDK